MTTYIHFDGACELNPANGKRNPGGIATYGWLIKKDDLTIAYGYGEAARGDNATNNLAEYEALVESLKAANDLGLKIDEIRGDSQLVVNQVNGKWRVNKSHLSQLKEEARKLINGSRLYWIPREDNQEADDLSKKAYQIALNQGASIWQQRFKCILKGA